MRKASSIPYGNGTISETGDSVRVEWICRNPMDLTGDVGCGRDGASEIKKTEPSMRDAREEKMSGIGQE